jgi:hypothetical protein
MGFVTVANTRMLSTKEQAPQTPLKTRGVKQKDIQ